MPTSPSWDFGFGSLQANRNLPSASLFNVLNAGEDRCQDVERGKPNMIADSERQQARGVPERRFGRPHLMLEHVADPQAFCCAESVEKRFPQ